MQITSIKKQDKRSRWSVYVDGEYSFSLSEWQYATSGLKKGQEITAKKLESLKFETEFGKLYDRVLKFLSLRPRSEFEIDQYLKKKSDNSELIEKVKAKLVDSGYINDKKFAESWVENRQAHKLFSIRRLRQELAQKRVDKEIIEDAIKGQDTDEVEIVRRIIEKKSSRYKDEQKLMAYLARQGFSYSTIKEALNKD